jgi:salicylate hydroxylase
VLHFSDGTTHETDVVVGADGIKSSVRRVVVCNDLEVEAEGSDAATVARDGKTDNSLVFMNMVTYRGVVPMAKVKSMGVKTDLISSPIFWLGNGRVDITHYMLLARAKIY